MIAAYIAAGFILGVACTVAAITAIVSLLDPSVSGDAMDKDRRK